MTESNEKIETLSSDDNNTTVETVESVQSVVEEKIETTPETIIQTVEVPRASFWQRHPNLWRYIVTGTVAFFAGMIVFAGINNVKQAEGKHNELRQEASRQRGSGQRPQEQVPPQAESTQTQQPTTTKTQKSSSATSNEATTTETPTQSGKTTKTA